MHGPTSSSPCARVPVRRVGLLVGAMAGMLVACGTAAGPVATSIPSVSPTAAPSNPTSQEPTVGPSPDESTVPVPSRDDLVTPEPGRLPSDVLPTPLPTRPVDPATMGAELQSVVTSAVRDLGSRVDGDVDVMLARPETFPDGSVGCPRPGQVVTQAQVEGYRILLRQGDRVWLYTAAAGQEPGLCRSDAKDGGFGFVPPPGLDD